ncbi:MAG: succinyldiaminopimelate transaminase [Steroidobacteraceae bacterium]
MNPRLARLQPYPFERLRELLKDGVPPAHLSPIPLSIGEPRHTPPPFVLEALARELPSIAQYPTTVGSLELRSACRDWLLRRFDLPAGSIDPQTHVLPVNGTREALFAIAQAVIDATPDHKGRPPLVAMPNPFYQIYEGAALLAGAEPLFLDTPAEQGFLPDLDQIASDTWDQVQLLYLCSPGNPAGAVMSEAQLARALDLADKHDFIVVTDECYAEIFFDETSPPPSLLGAAWRSGRQDFSRCLVFHSLSKRSNLPGLRSGFVAGDARLINDFLLYRTYHGCSMPPPTQVASTLAWADDAHVLANRDAYRAKFRAVQEILQDVADIEIPAGGFYLWMNVGGRWSGDDERFVRDLFVDQHITVVPGSYLARPSQGAGPSTTHTNPGQGRVRISLVASLEDCIEAAHRIRRQLQG